MKTLTRRKALVAGSVFCVAAGVAKTASANGDTFYEAEEIPGQTVFVYYGSVKDVDGNYIDGATITVDVSEPSLTYDAFTNVIGRYRTLDVGRAITDLGYEVDQSKMTVTVTKPGYKQVRRFSRARVTQTRGQAELDFTLAKISPEEAKKAKSQG